MITDYSKVAPKKPRKKPKSDTRKLFELECHVAMVLACYDNGHFKQSSEYGQECLANLAKLVDNDYKEAP